MNFRRGSCCFRIMLLLDTCNQIHVAQRFANIEFNDTSITNMAQSCGTCPDCNPASKSADDLLQSEDLWLQRETKRMFEETNITLSSFVCALRARPSPLHLHEPNFHMISWKPRVTSSRFPNGVRQQEPSLWPFAVSLRINPDAACVH